jgi:hypothetical protein
MSHVGLVGLNFVLMIPACLVEASRGIDAGARQPNVLPSPPCKGKEEKDH